MKKYICSICGYVYDEAKGNAEGIEPGTKWEDVPEDWVCPLCGAAKDEFIQEQDKNYQEAISVENDVDDSDHKLRELSFGELSALFSNLSKGASKQYKNEEAELFNTLAEYYIGKCEERDDTKIEDFAEFVKKDIELFTEANLIAKKQVDRGAQRALVWGEKVTRMMSSILTRYDKQKDALLENTHIYVCDICGYIYIGDDLPTICPVCKVPNKKILEIKRGE